MKRFLILLCLCIFSITMVFAQTETENTEEDFVYKMNQKGDQHIHLDLNLDIPYKPDISHLKLGGEGTLGYNRLITDSIMLGGEVSFAYNTTIGDNIFYAVPLLFKVTYQFTSKKLEIPLSLGIGGSFQNYVDRTYFGLTIKPEIGVFYRQSPDWSFGVRTGLFIMPQWYKNSENNYLGIIQDIGLAVRYHF